MSLTTMYSIIFELLGSYCIDIEIRFIIEHCIFNYFALYVLCLGGVLIGWLQLSIVTIQTNFTCALNRKWQLLENNTPSAKFY